MGTACWAFMKRAPISASEALAMTFFIILARTRIGLLKVVWLQLPRKQYPAMQERDLAATR